MPLYGGHVQPESLRLKLKLLKSTFNAVNFIHA